MNAPTFTDLSPGVVVEGPILPEPVEVIAVMPMGASIKLRSPRSRRQRSRCASWASPRA
jgi:hypothetical protein